MQKKDNIFPKKNYLIISDETIDIKCKTFCLKQNDKSLK